MTRCTRSGSQSQNSTSTISIISPLRTAPPCRQKAASSPRFPAAPARFSPRTASVSTMGTSTSSGPPSFRGGMQQGGGTSDYVAFPKGAPQQVAPRQIRLPSAGDLTYVDASTRIQQLWVDKEPPFETRSDTDTLPDSRPMNYSLLYGLPPEGARASSSYIAYPAPINTAGQRTRGTVFGANRTPHAGRRTTRHGRVHRWYVDWVSTGGSHEQLHLAEPRHGRRSGESIHCVVRYGRRRQLRRILGDYGAGVESRHQPDHAQRFRPGRHRDHVGHAFWIDAGSSGCHRDGLASLLDCPGYMSLAATTRSQKPARALRFSSPQYSTMPANRSSLPPC